VVRRNDVEILIYEEAKIGMNVKRFVTYLFRWQLSTPILAPVVSFFKFGCFTFGTLQDWLGAGVANLIGGAIFYWVDRFIFTSKSLDIQWEVKSNVECADCHKMGTGYRIAIVKSKDYDKSKDKNPEFRCTNCCRVKAGELGVVF